MATLVRVHREKVVQYTEVVWLLCVFASACCVQDQCEGNLKYQGFARVDEENAMRGEKQEYHEDWVHPSQEEWGRGECLF